MPIHSRMVMPFLTTGSAAMGLERRNIARATMTRPKPQSPRMAPKIIGKVNIISVVGS